MPICTMRLGSKSPPRRRGGTACRGCICSRRNRCPRCRCGRRNGPCRAPGFGDGADDRQRDQVIAAGRQRHGAGGVDLGEVLFDAHQRIVEARRIDRRVAEVAAFGQFIGRHARHVMDAAHHGREIAHLARTVARARPVGRAAVPRHADHADLDVGRVAEHRQAHEGGDVAEARDHRAGDRLGEVLGVGHTILILLVGAPPSGAQS